jgi:hypothetical protein
MRPSKPAVNTNLPTFYLSTEEIKESSVIYSAIFAADIVKTGF